MRDIDVVTADMRKMFENLAAMFHPWKKEYHEPFISELGKLYPLEKELEEITGNEQKAYLIKVDIYYSVFPQENPQNPVRVTVSGDHSVLSGDHKGTPLL